MYPEDLVLVAVVACPEDFGPIQRIFFACPFLWYNWLMGTAASSEVRND
jgi:hypothetical protein